MIDEVEVYGAGENGYYDAELNRLINEMIALEVNVSRLYALFLERFPEDVEFWQNLSAEEENHAALLRSGRKHFASQGTFPRELLPESIDPLLETNRELERLIELFETTPPTREDAFRLAVALEESAGEIHYQRAMTTTASSQAMKILQTLNHDDRDHAARIRQYMTAKGIGGTEGSEGQE